MQFIQRVADVMRKASSLVCIGLDSEVEKLPSHIKDSSNAQFHFNKAIIDATHRVVCAYKPNTAFYEAYGAEGILQLKQTCDYIRTTYPDVLLIVDAKRGDIGNTNNGYSEFAFEYLGADAITLHPYLGQEALQPFLDREDKGAIILCRTSNPGSGELQEVLVNGKALYEHIAYKVSKEWNKNNNCMLVVGATYPKELANIREIAGSEMTFLVPGVGAQGGDVEAIVKAGKNSEGTGLIISSSRNIIFASRDRDFAEKACDETMRLRTMINQYL